MDKFFPALFVLLLVAFAAIAAVEACSRHEPHRYELEQQAAVEDGRGEFYYDQHGKKRFRWFGEE